MGVVSSAKRGLMALILTLGLAHAALGAQGEHPATSDGLIEGADTRFKMSRCFTFEDVEVLDVARTDEVGDDIYVTPAPKARCAPDPAAWKVTPPHAADYFLGRSRNALVIDEGSGDARVVHVFDVAAKAEGFSSPYAEPIYLKGPVLTFWKPSEAKATRANCRDYAAIVKQGLTPALQIETTVDLASQPWTAKPGRAQRCVAAQ